MRNRGFTLIEVLVTSALFSCVMLGVYQLYTTMQETLSRGEVKADLQQNARSGLDRLVQELRMAGYGVGGSGDPLRAAGPSCLAFVTNGSQISYDTAEDVTDPGMPRRKLLRRREGGGGAQPLAEAVALLSFAYYDVYNVLLVPGSSGSCPPGSAVSSLVLSAAQRRQVTRVAILLRTSAPLRDEHPGLGPPTYTPASYTLKVHVRLRNR